MKQIEIKHQQKHFIMLLFISFCFFIIIGRLIQLQIIQHERFLQSGEKNFTRFKTIPAQRGNILDCNRKVLVTNNPTTNVIWQGTGNKNLTDLQIEIAEKACRELNSPISIKSIARAEYYSKKELLAEKISNDSLSFLAEQCSDTENIIFETSYERFYPYKKIACHLLGYLSGSNNMNNGKMGIEKIFENILSGNPGVNIEQINSFGTLLEKKAIKNQLDGQDIVTTIDLKLQKMVEKCIKPYKAGTIIILNPETGHIPALVSMPNFDPTILSKKISVEEWKEIEENRPFLNRAFNSSYPPSSIFKLITATAALEEKIIDTETEFDCIGYTIFKKQRYLCNRHSGHGIINLKEGLAFSCNIPFYEIAQKMPIDTLASYAFKFGLGRKTDILFSEQYGLIPTNDWKLEMKGEKWWTGETLSAAIGQSFILTTPIQIACMIGAIFKGYLTKPTILKNIDISRTPVNVSKKTLDFLQDSMKYAITSGTGRRIKHHLNLTIFAKTGTAQTISRKKRRRSNNKHLEHAWFASYFYTDKSEPLVLIIFLENVGGSKIATNVANDFFKFFSKDLNKIN